MDILGADERIMVLSPHADDEVFGCGGYLLKARNLGAAIHIVYFQVGDSCHGFGSNSKLVAGSIRIQEIKNVTKKLKASYEIFYPFPEQELKMDTLSRRELINNTEAVIGRFKPTQILIPSPSFNQDHEVVYKTGLAVSRPPAWSKNYIINKVIVFNSHLIRWENKSFQPNLFVDISDVFKEKQKLIKIYKSQLRSGTYLSIEHIENYSNCLGKEYLMDRAENFEIKRVIL